MDRLLLSHAPFDSSTRPSFACGSPSVSSAEALLGWDISAATEQLVNRNLDIQIAKTKVEQSEARSSEAFSVYLPQGELSAEFSSGPGYRGGPLDGGLDYGNADAVIRARLQLGLLVFAFGQARALNDLAEDHTQIKEMELAILVAKKKQDLRLSYLEGGLASSYENSIQVVLAEVRERLANVPSDDAELKSGLLELEGLLHEALRNGKSVRQEMERRIWIP